MLSLVRAISRVSVTTSPQLPPLASPSRAGPGLACVQPRLPSPRPLRRFSLQVLRARSKDARNTTALRRLTRGPHGSKVNKPAAWRRRTSDIASTYTLNTSFYMRGSPSQNALTTFRARPELYLRRVRKQGQHAVSRINPPMHPQGRLLNHRWRRWPRHRPPHRRQRRQGHSPRHLHQQPQPRCRYQKRRP